MSTVPLYAALLMPNSEGSSHHRPCWHLMICSRRKRSRRAAQRADEHSCMQRQGCIVMSIARHAALYTQAA